MGWRAIVAIGALLCATTAQSQTTRCERFPPGGYVGVYADSLAQDSLIVLAPVPGGWVGSFYILAVLNGVVSDGILRADFRVHLPLAVPAPFVNWTPSPAVSFWFGQPFAIGTDPGGVSIVWAACQHGQLAGDGKRVVQVARVEVVGLSAFDTPVYVKKLSSPDTNAPCAIFRKCDSPLFTPAPMVVRGADSLRASSWGLVKALYK